jgi:hypothetical protein
VTVTGFPVPHLTESGLLPRGVTFSSASASFQGIPRAGTSGRYPVMITAQSAAGTVTQNFILTVS